ncbi:LLM class flavin-dependent oxidoreductase [Nocardia sp. NPDC052112]|uniref:LLM class flavin-dependent oxidoreductase n=1 Tax=Nocardia sp. NPDC052112 TaxID=3155646 RepID=UPI00343A7E32
MRRHSPCCCAPRPSESGSGHRVSRSRHGSRRPRQSVRRWPIRARYRFGLECFGIEQFPHDDRYLLSAEWPEIMESLWAKHGELDHDGRFYTIGKGYLEPKTIQLQPVIVAAGRSPAGLDFGITHADYCFVAGDNWDLFGQRMQRRKTHAAGLNRELNALTFGTVVVKDTEAEAKRHFEWYVDELGDLETARRLANNIISGGAPALPPEVVAKRARAYVGGMGRVAAGGHRRTGCRQTRAHERYGNRHCRHDGLRFELPGNFVPSGEFSGRHETRYSRKPPDVQHGELSHRQANGTIGAHLPWQLDMEVTTSIPANLSQ